MRNKNRPFFYEDKKAFWPKLLFFLIVIIIFIFWGIRVPRIRQILGWRIIDGGSFAKSLFVPISTPNPQQFRVSVIYPTIDTPSEEVIFAENLDELSENNLMSDQNPLITPTPGITWFIEELQPTISPLLPYGESGNSAAIIPPVFEYQDYQNDGPAVLSAVLRFFGKHESQYLIAKSVKPDYLDPNVSFEELELYVGETYPEFGCIVRINGNIEILNNLILAGLPVVIRIETEKGFSAWEGDDRIDSRYILVTGYDNASNLIFFQDPFKGDQQSVSSEKLMSDWYPYLREYLVVYPTEKEPVVQQILGDSREKKSNLNNALEKFRTDSDMLPENIFTWLNTAIVLVREEQYENAWNIYKSTLNLNLPQRYFLYNPSLYTAAFRTGNADELTTLTGFTLRINSHSEESWLWKGWANILRGELEDAKSCFQKALSIRPNYRDAVYALKFLEKQ
jgi:tetratricopeptide (TPR) repeat protein